MHGQRIGQARIKSLLCKMQKNVIIVTYWFLQGELCSIQPVDHQGYDRALALSGAGDRARRPVPPSSSRTCSSRKSSSRTATSCSPPRTLTTTGWANSSCARGKITKVQFDAASATIRKTNKKLGVVLFELGILSPKDLVDPGQASGETYHSELVQLARRHLSH